MSRAFCSKDAKISAKTAYDICTYSILVPNCSILFILTLLLSGIYRRTKIKNMVHLRVEYCLILTVAGFVFYCTKNVRNELWAFLYSPEWFGTKLPSSERFSHLRNGLGTEFHCAWIYRSSFRKNKPKTLVFFDWNECCCLVFAKTKSLNSSTGEFTTRTYVVFALIFPLFILL